MARTLNARHEEAPATSPLFTAFLLLALGWMLVSAALASADPIADQPAIAISEQ